MIVKPSMLQKILRFSRPARTNSRKSNGRLQLRSESLESRQMLTTFTVTNLNDSGPGSLREAVENSNLSTGADDIVFDAGLLGTIDLSTELNITEGVSITGSNNVNINAQMNSRVFNIDDGDPNSVADVNITNMSMFGGFDLFAGGAILNKEDLFLQDSSIVGSSSLDGGAIRNEGQLTADRCVFASNTAANGGAISSDNPDQDVFLNECQILGNSAMYLGGGINASESNVTVNNSYLGNNYSGFDGGAFNGFNATFTITNSELSGNTAEQGGAGALSGGQLDCNQCTFYNNSATGLGNYSSGTGGALALFFAYVNSQNSEFNNNLAPRHGGAVFNAYGSEFNDTGSTFHSNNAPKGGAFANDNYSNGNFNGTTFSSNDATEMGGAVYNLDAFMNRSTSGFGPPQLNFDGVTFDNNTANSGGAVFIGAGNSFEIANSTLSNNSATTEGGALVAIQNTIGNVINSTVAGNEAQTGGGFLLQGSTVGVASSTIADNSASSLGGGVSLDNAANLNLLNSILADNTGGASGDLDGSATAYFSLIEDTGGATLSGNNNITGVDPNLGALANNGGPTLTMLPAASSPAIDAGDPAAQAGQGNTPDFDQRGQNRVANGRIDIGAVEAQGAVVVDGDFNDDGLFDCMDIDALVAEIAAGTNNAAFDLTGDGNVDIADRDAWLAEAGNINLGPGLVYLLGDANLDGVVDGNDFITWNDNKFTGGNGWCGADFTADGFTDGVDFITWNDNKFQTSDVGLLIDPTQPDRQRMGERTVETDRAIVEPTEDAGSVPALPTSTFRSAVAATNSLRDAADEQRDAGDNRNTPIRDLLGSLS